jgi:hypothetical protein
VILPPILLLGLGAAVVAARTSADDALACRKDKHDDEGVNALRPDASANEPESPPELTAKWPTSRTSWADQGEDSSASDANGDPLPQGQSRPRDDDAEFVGA